MEVITIQSDAFRELVTKLDEIRSQVVQHHKQNPLSDIWLDISDTCRLLKISKRTLQNYRDKKVLSFSQIGGKIFFKASDIQSLMEKHYQSADTSRK
ncbi:MAG: helix-turn-helix domain-containing protein [Bacteroidota bacterium]